MTAEPSLSEVRAQAGRRGAEASWRGVDAPEERAERTAAAREASLRARRAEVAKRQVLVDRIRAIEAALPSMAPEERARQFRLLAEFVEADVQLKASRRRGRQSTVAENELAS